MNHESQFSFTDNVTANVTLMLSNFTRNVIAKGTRIATYNNTITNA